jgi:signal transduction histidine kinase
MARIADSLAGRLGLVALAILVLLLPVLYVGLDRIVARSQQQMFVTDIRTYARLLADEFELGSATDSEERTRALLENVLLSREGVFAELEFDGRTVRAELDRTTGAESFPGEDFAYGAGGDQAYYLSTPIVHDKRSGVLRIGFDERPVEATIRETRRRVLFSLGAFFVVSLLMAVYFGRRLAQPLVELQRASRQVASGELAATLETGSDISELRELGRDLEFMRTELVSVSGRLREQMREREIADRERRELEDRLAERRRLATVGTLAGGIAHEFNNILVPIQLYTELAIDDLGAGHPVRADLERVQDAARRAKRIVNDIFAFTRGKDHEEFGSVNAADVAAEVLRLYEHMVPGGIHVVQVIEPGCPPVVGDAGMINQVIHNLCANAVQAMVDVTGELKVSVMPASDTHSSQAGLAPGTCLDICVSDSGHGMDSEVRKRIFEPFFTTRTVGRGTGLGLFVVHGMVESMGGAVVVESAPGAGTSFHVLLQIASSTAVADFSGTQAEG